MNGKKIALLIVEALGAFVLNIVLVNIISASDLALWFKISLFIVLGAGDVIGILKLLKQLS
jgi:hypothetical protein